VSSYSEEKLKNGFTQSGKRMIMISLIKDMIRRSDFPVRVTVLSAAYSGFNVIAHHKVDP
jgi:hypothetical protein